MEIIKIINLHDYITEHFRYSEYFHPLLSPNDIEYDCPKCLIDGMEIIRKFYNISIDITSTIRPFPNQAFHFNGNAVDSICSDRDKASEYLNTFRDECLKYQKDRSSELIKSLRNVGVKGFGIESVCIHIDFRPDKNCPDKDELGMYCIFEWSKEKGSKVYHSLL